MMEFFTQLPPWLQEFFVWLSTGTNLATLVTAAVSIFKIGSLKNQNKNVGDAQINLLGKMTEKLADTKDLASLVDTAVSQTKDCLSVMQSAVEGQRLANANLALFVMECFNKSNLSDEAKAELRVMADKIFFEDNTKAIEALESINSAAETALTEARAKIAELTAQLEEEHNKLILAQENVKATRRV